MSFRIYLTVFFCLTVLNIQSQNRLKPYDDYINQYSGIALEQQNLHGIPACITLAQGLLESGAGKSEMARASNNHFGIKCHSNWQGQTSTFFDDGIYACFRKYDRVEDSYEDHSQFLVQGSRYAFLFKLDIKDYQGWSEGLQKAGYATDRTYAEKLIRIIETYKLHEITKGKTVKEVKEKRIKEKRVKKAREDKAARKAKTVSVRTNSLNNEVLKNAKDYQAMGYNTNKESISPLSEHEIKYMETTPYIIAQYGDSFSGLAEEFGISVSRIRNLNEFPANYTLTPGEPVYLDKKTNWWEGEHPLHRVVKGESIHSISQKYGMQVNSLYKLNSMNVGDTVVVGQKIKLRNPEQLSPIIKAMNDAVYKKDSVK